MGTKVTIDWDNNKKVYFVKVGVSNQRFSNASVQGLQSDLRKKGITDVKYSFTWRAKRQINNKNPRFI